MFNLLDLVNRTKFLVGVALTFVSCVTFAADYTAGESVITRESLDPLVKSVISTLTLVSVSAFSLIGFGVSLYVVFKVIKSLFKTSNYRSCS